VPVGNEEIAVVLVLELNPVLKGAVKVAEMKAPGGAHAA
jgi:hypothetical protein